MSAHVSDPGDGLELRDDLVVLRDLVPEDRAAFVDRAAETWRGRRPRLRFEISAAGLHGAADGAGH